MIYYGTTVGSACCRTNHSRYSRNLRIRSGVHVLRFWCTGTCVHVYVCLCLCVCLCVFARVCVRVCALELLVLVYFHSFRVHSFFVPFLNVFFFSLLSKRLKISRSSSSSALFLTHILPTVLPYPPSSSSSTLSLAQICIHGNLYSYSLIDTTILIHTHSLKHLHSD